MENSYGIGVRNRYELFYDEEIDPIEYLKKTGNKKREKKDKISEKENKAKTINTKDSLPGKKIPTTNIEIETKPAVEKTSPTESKQKPRNSERVKFSDREERNNRRNKPEFDNKESRDRDNRENYRDIRENRENKDNKDSKENRENGVPQRFDGESRGRGGRGSGFRGGRGIGRGGGRGGRGGNSGGLGGGDFRSKREFDRQSGMVTSGVKPVDKREGNGPYNWGSDKEPIGLDEQQDDQATDLDTSGENTEKPAGDQEGSAATPSNGEVEGQKEEEQREMTLDEWKALQKREKPVFHTRRAGEGDSAQWKNTYILKKKTNEATSEGSDEEELVQHGRKKVLLPIDFQFADTPTRGRGRGRGRGGPGRGGRGMGGGRGRGAAGRFQGNSRQEAPKMDDERDFPSLG